MKKEILYTYLGDNGMVTTPIHLEGIPSTKRISLRAEEGKILINGELRKTSVTIPESELKNWIEEKA